MRRRLEPTYEGLKRQLAFPAAVAAVLIVWSLPMRD